MRQHREGDAAPQAHSLRVRGLARGCALWRTPSRIRFDLQPSSGYFRPQSPSVCPFSPYSTPSGDYFRRQSRTVCAFSAFRWLFSTSVSSGLLICSLPVAIFDLSLERFAHFQPSGSYFRPQFRAVCSFSAFRWLFSTSVSSGLLISSRLRRVFKPNTALT